MWLKLKARTRTETKTSTQLTLKAVRDDSSQDPFHLLEGRLPRHHAGRGLCHLCSLSLWTGRLHQPERPVSLGAVDWLRRDVRRHAGRDRKSTRLNSSH